MSVDPKPNDSLVLLQYIAHDMAQIIWAEDPDMVTLLSPRTQEWVKEQRLKDLAYGHRWWSAKDDT